MTAITVSYRRDGDEIWDKCDQFGINPSALGTIEGSAWAESAFYDAGLRLNDSASGAGTDLDAFVLFSPELNNKTIARLLAVRKDKNVPSGFRVRDFLFSKNIYVVDPDKYFPDAALVSLQNDGFNVVQVSGNTPKEMSDNLKALLEAL